MHFSDTQSFAKTKSIAPEEGWGGELLVIVIFYKSHSRKKNPLLLHLPFNALELLRERQKNIFISPHTAATARE